MDIRPKSIQDLYHKLKDITSLKEKLFLSENTLTIVLNEHYKIDVKLNGDFCTFINDEFDYAIEDQDIVDVLKDISENNYYVVQRKKSTFFHRQKFEFLSEQEYLKRKDKLLKTHNIKIFNHNSIIYDAL